MPLTNDRQSLRRLEAETERAVDYLRSQGDASLEQRYSRELFKLGEIRARLGRIDEAETLFDESARLALKLGETSDIEFAAATRLRQASVAAAAGRHHDALAIIDRMVSSLGGFPKLEGLGGAAPGLQLWLTLLHTVGDTQRLYEASGVALELLSPPVSREMRIVLLRACVFRGRTAKALGYADEAIEMYTRAIAQADKVRPPLIDDPLLESAILNLPGLLEQVDRDDGLPAAYAQIVSRLASSKTFPNRTAVRAARAWLRADQRS